MRSCYNVDELRSRIEIPHYLRSEIIAIKHAVSIAISLIAATFLMRDTPTPEPELLLIVKLIEQNGGK